MSANVLETFVLLYQSDAQEVTDGAKQAGEASDKLENKLKGVDKQAGKAGNTFKALAKRAVNMLMPFVGLSALKGAAMNFAASAYEAGQLSEALKMDTEALQAWQGAAARAGGDANGMADSIANLNDNLKAIKKGGGGDAASALRELGISAKDSRGQIKTADALLRDLAGKFDGLSKERAVELGEKLGLDEGTIALLQKGSKGVEELLARQKELGLYSKKDAEDARKMKNAWDDCGQAFKSIAAIVMRHLLPVITGIGDGLTTAAVNIRKHRDLVTGFFIALAAVMGVLAIKTTIAFAPFLAMAAIVMLVAAAFAVLYDDVMHFLGGHDSVIGRLSKDYPQLGEWVKAVVETLALLWEVAKAVGVMLVESIQNPAQAFENFKNKVGPLVDAFAEKFPVLGQAIKDVGTIIKWLWDMAKPLLKMLLGLVKDVLGFIFDKIGKIAGLIGKALSWVGKKIRGQEDDGKDDMDALLDEESEDKPGPDPDPDPETPEPPQDGPQPEAPRPETTDKPEAPGPEPAPRPATAAPEEKRETPTPQPAAPVTAEKPLPAPAAAPIPEPAIRPQAETRQKPAPVAGPDSPMPAVPPRPATMPAPYAVPPELAANIQKGRDAMAQTNTPLPNMPKAPQAITETVTRNYNVTISNVEVITQATDAEGVSQGLGSALEAQIRSAVDNFDDGVAA